MQFTKLQVIDRTEESQATCSLFLEKPAGFEYYAGQHLPIRFLLDGKEARRTYTLSSSPLDPHLQITVKRVKEGLVSNHINDNVQKGDVIEARPPIGHIYVGCAPQNYRTLYLFASEDTIIFRQGLDALQEQYGERFRVAHVLSAPKKESWSALWSTDLINDARKGRIDGDALKWFVDEFRPS